MSQLDPEILADFLQEANHLIDQMLDILTKCEGDFGQVKSLEEYGLLVDRIMGGAKSLAIEVTDTNHVIYQLGDVCAICKAVGYKGSQITENENLYEIVVALLLDASEMMPKMLDLVQTNENINSVLNRTFLERVKWVNDKFGSDYRASVEVKSDTKTKLNQADIDELLKKLGLD
jgi:hypothetical protein